MAPLRPQASRASSRSSAFIDAEDGRQLQQAGRSSSNLAAAASAQSLREEARSRPSSRGLNRPASQPNLLRKKSRPVPTPSNVDAIAETEAASSDNERGLEMAQSSHGPTPVSVSSLAARPGLGSGDAASSRKNSNESGSASTTSGPPAVRSKASLLPPSTAVSASSSRPTRPNSYQPEMQENLSSLSLTRQQTPRTIRDLGSDYNRYYNPFSSRNTSQQDLNSPLPRYNSQTHLMAPGALSSTDLSKRLSNPFGDTNRLSNPFESAHNSAPGTPIQKSNSNGQDKQAKVTAAGLGVAGAGAGAGAALTADTSRTGTPAMIRDADPEKATFFPYVDDRLGAPDYSFPLFTDAKEDDDDMHMPMWDDDIKLKAVWRDRFARENIVSTLGMLFMVSGLLCIFVVLPVISFTGTNLIPYGSETPLDQMPGAFRRPADPSSWAYVNGDKYPLLKNLRTDLIDPDTPDDVKTRKDINGNTMKLVFSDEFNQKNRTFYPGDDPYWFAPDIWYGATMDMEWYDPDAVNTGDGTLQLQLDKFPSHNLDFRSGMLNSWNQLCFKGGVFEISASLPGPAGVHGFWPGAWTMGNLGRPGYLSTTDGMWPYTYNDCDVGITPNQSAPDGLNFLPGQRLSSCSCRDEDHPTPGTGRGAPEIDIIEVSGDWGGMGVGVATQSFQVAPFDIWWYPDYEFMETPNYNLSFVNTYTGGPFQQAVSTTSMLNNNWYDGKEYQKYAFEYAPGSGSDAYIKWFVGDDEMMMFDGRAIGPNGNIGQRMVSEEPMSMILNFGFSENWVNIDWDNLRFPAVYRIDYVRWYQLEGQELVTCDPPGFETTEYIANHPAAYNNPNYTHWEDAGYKWPTNTFMDGCEA